MRFADRSEAGRRLAEALEDRRGPDLVVLGLPRGGVAVAAEVAAALDAPLDVIVVRKLGVPRQPELAMGAIGEDGVRVLNERVISAVGATDEQLRAVEQRERSELDRRLAVLREGRPAAPVIGRTVIVVDDGIATGATAAAGCEVARARGAATVVLAAPVAAPDAIERLGAVADEVVSLWSPTDFAAVGRAYADFSPTTERDVITLLRGRRAAP